jgi:hypothetical protein
MAGKDVCTAREKPAFTVYRDSRSLPDDVRDAIVQAYVAVFSEPPWSERWDYATVAERLRRDLSGSESFLTLMRSAGPSPIAGFCWGSVIPQADAVGRVRCSHPTMDHRKLTAMVTAIEPRIMFVDEIAILPRYRDRGVGPIDLLHLVWPVVLAVKNEKVGTLCWSGRDARIVPILTEFLEFVTLGTVGAVSFYYMPVERGIEVANRLTEQFDSVIQLTTQAAGPPI